MMPKDSTKSASGRVGEGECRGKEVRQEGQEEHSKRQAGRRAGEGPKTAGKVRLTA